MLSGMIQSIGVGGTVETSELNLLTGNVGIGTASPETQLHLISTTTKKLRVGYDTTNYFELGSTANIATIDMEGVDLQIRDGVTPRMVVLETGNVGIGTTVPDTILHLQSGQSIGTIQSSTTDSPSVLRLKHSSLNSNVNAGQIQFDVVGNELARISGHLGAASTEGFLAFYTRNSGSVGERVRITKDGNVGIGTTSPSYKLTVNHTGDNYSAIVTNDETTVSNDTGIYLRTTEEGRISVGSSANLNFVTGGPTGTSRLFIDGGNNGNVGIGTTSPRTKLHVIGLTGDDDPSLGNSTAPLLVSNTANSYGLNVGVNNVGAAWLQAQSNTSAIAYDLLLSPLGGNVGIGITSPDTKLHVRGSGTSGVIVIETDNNSNDRTLEFHNSSGATEWRLGVDNGVGTSKFMIGKSNNTAELVIDSSGNVGIGTTNPSAKLDIASTTSGFLPPRMTTIQRDAISTPATGLVIYNTTTNVLNFHNGGSWGAV